MRQVPIVGIYDLIDCSAVVHLNDIPPVLRWLQWFSLLKYCLEALSVNEVDAGLQIVDTLQGVPVNVSAQLIMNLASIPCLRFFDWLTLFAALRFRCKQLLSRHSRLICFYCRVRHRINRRRMAERARATLNEDLQYFYISSSYWSHIPVTYLQYVYTTSFRTLLWTEFDRARNVRAKPW